jgi:hypothetical protein
MGAKSSAAGANWYKGFRQTAQILMRHVAARPLDEKVSSLLD